LTQTCGHPVVFHQQFYWNS